MALILNIDTATEQASIALAQSGEVVGKKENREQKEHAAWLHVAIQELLDQTGFVIRQVEAVAITAGPGSYTGLRVGMSAAKGICFALKIPLITQNTLRVMALAALENTVEKDVWICPMIDARRMEVFTAIYSETLEELFPTSAIILEEALFTDFFVQRRILFVGSGASKWQEISKNPKAVFGEIGFLAPYLAKLSEKNFELGKFTDNIYSEPVYTKEFYTHTKK